MTSTESTTRPTGRLETFRMPDAGEGLTEADIIGWRVAVGDTVTVNQVIVEIETAKAAVELPCPYAGRVHQLLAEPGATVEVGTPIITIDTGTDTGTAPAGDHGAVVEGGPVNGAAAETGSKIGEVTADGRIATLVGYVPAGRSGGRRARRAAPTGAAAPASRAPAAPVSSPPPVPAEPEPPAAHATHAAPLATPPVRKLAKDLGIDLHAVAPSRADGVISREDVEHAAAARTRPAAGPDREPAPPAARASTRPDDGSREYRIAVTGVRKATAAAMVASAFTAPHVTEFLTVDVTPMMQLRERLRTRREFADAPPTPLALTARAVCLAARRTPEINSVYEAGTDGPDQILVKRDVHLGIAAATDRGLIVPVIRDADAMGLADLARALQELTATARAGRTSLAQLTGGTFTITNVGVFGVDTGTPIINPGQSAILALGAIRDAPWVVDGELAVRKVCQLALSFDHRVIDGQQGSQFLADIGALLADPGLALAF
ncbi:MAG TPA: dihydrolipoamide acetyltransferase family protein [Nakamurella multipartita]|uniref:Dihydrolipoamide acetyltransferase component of pyruvate dehydrogenase complex n=2 Tax=Nakamurella TaxID=53460 RepID=C8XD85_NAKMY|nr:dihydrolipoamide acetyltransferase family protein [Nakamurella multipartita]ACV81575.1 catalytic domain of components of various dehydrogenase complexes [Nakamurella multipartita DSM 44233]HOZ57139.1 dihydrolipoamide acetyltransferase family protein [Nakamurella multipartita]